MTSWLRAPFPVREGTLPEHADEPHLPHLDEWWNALKRPSGEITDRPRRPLLAELLTSRF